MHWYSSQGNVLYTRWLLEVGRMVYSARCAGSGFIQSVATFQKTSTCTVIEQKNNSHTH